MVRQLGEPGVVVDAGTAPLHLLIGYVGIARQLLRGSLHRVAEAYDLHLGGPERGQGEDRHRIGVVQHEGVGTELFGVVEDVQPVGSGAQRLEDSAGADGVADTLFDPVFHGDLVVELDGLEAVDLDEVDDVVGAPHHLAPFRGGFHRPALAGEGDDLLGELMGHLQTHGVDVDQCEASAIQIGDQQDVHHQLPGEDCASRAHQCDFRHSGNSYSVCPARLGERDAVDQDHTHHDGQRQAQMAEQRAVSSLLP